jgi:hypothetical protein
LFKGIKLAILEAKLTLVKILKTYDVFSDDSNEKNYVFTEAGLRKIKGGVKCQFKKRDIN